MVFIYGNEEKNVFEKLFCLNKCMISLCFFEYVSFIDSGPGHFHFIVFVPFQIEIVFIMAD